MAEVKERTKLENLSFQDVDEVPKQTREGVSHAVVQDFLDSGSVARKISGGTPSFKASLARYIKDHNLTDTIKATTIEGQLYLARVTEGEEAGGDGAEPTEA